MSKELKVVGIQVHDVLGLQEYSLAPGRVTVLAGANGSGKSSVLSAVQAALGGGSLARLARVSKDGAKAEDPRVVLVIEGPGAEAYRVERDGEKVRVRKRVGDTQAFEDVRTPQAWLSSIFDPAGSNPVAFLLAKDERRAQLLLEALPLKMDRAALAAALEGVPSDALRPVPAGLHPLEEIEQLYDSVFTARTGVNRDLEGKKKSADQLRRSLPAELPADPAAAVTAALEAVTKIAGAVAQAEAAARSAEAQAIHGANAVHKAACDAIAAENREAVQTRRATHDKWAAERRAAVEREIEAGRLDMERELDLVRAANEERLEAADEALKADTETARAARAAADADVEVLRRELVGAQQRATSLRAQAEEAQRTRALDEQAREFEAQAEQLGRTSDELTAALERLKALRRQLAEHLPIEGLSIAEKVVKVRGVPFEQLNTAQKVEIAVKVACLRAQEQRLPIVWVDEAERLDTAHFDALVAELKRQKVQAFVGRVADHELSVESVA
jgi:energy-coupling factor transporter ATP-binding protein EcfA2